MSRIGKKPIPLAKEFQVSIKDKIIEVTGPKGKLNLEIKDGVNVEIKDNEVIFSRNSENKNIRALHGLYRALVNNMIKGVTEGFSKKLDLVGIGYKAELKGNNIAFALGYSHPIIFTAPPDVKIEIPAPNNVIVSGIDKQLVGLVAAKIRSLRPPEPYKGKGVKYSDETVRRKAGKTASK
ncbi:MAG TPA: 50S ribosomal protein L6 [Ignavibacteria bacterium]|nr:50S ribosomal protein L6 [Ignavibacteria bacterium]